MESSHIGRFCPTSQTSSRRSESGTADTPGGRGCKGHRVFLQDVEQDLNLGRWSCNFIPTRRTLHPTFRIGVLYIVLEPIPYKGKLAKPTPKPGEALPEVGDAISIFLAVEAGIRFGGHGGSKGEDEEASG